MADVAVQATGPLFDGRAGRVMDAAAQEAEEEIGRVAAEELRARTREAKHPTGNFAKRVIVDMRRGDGVRVHTPGLRYDAWLEGKTRRNQISSFKGYGWFRETRQDIEARAGGIAEHVIGQRVKELNG